MDAAAHCKEQNMTLMTVKDAFDTAYLLKHGCFSEANYHGWKCMWIGLHDHTTEGQWTWLSGGQPTYTNWGPGEPNDWGGREDCAEMCRNFASEGEWGKWNDGHCERPLSYCCDEMSSGDLPLATALRFETEVFSAEKPPEGGMGQCEYGWIPGSDTVKVNAASHTHPPFPLLALIVSSSVIVQ